MKIGKIGQLFGRVLSKEKILPKNTLEISAPLSSLLGMKLQGKQYSQFMENVYSLIEVYNPAKNMKISSEEKERFENLIALEEIPRIIRLENVEELTLKQIKNYVTNDFDQKFSQLRKCYNSLEQGKAKAFINKSLHFILTSKKEGLEDFVRLAESLPIPKNSDLMFYNNWFLVSDKFKQRINSSLEALEDLYSNEQVRTLKEEMAEKSKHYIHDLRKLIETPEIKKIITDMGLERHSLRIANNLVNNGSLMLPKIDNVTEHTCKDLNDLVKYQFPDKDLYCIEEASNSKDAKAKNAKFKFFSNGLVIEDDGHGMDRKMFCEEYPFPYLSFKKGELNIGRFGAGAKAKLIEVMEHKGEVLVESKSEDSDAITQRYFMHDSTLYLGFSKSNKSNAGTKVVIISPERTKEDKANQKKLMMERLSYFNPEKIKLTIGRKTINKNSLLGNPEIEAIDYNGEKSRVYFNPEKNGELVLLSGEVLINKTKAPFQLLIEVPLQFQPVEGRNDFVYDEELKLYLADVFRKTVKPKLKEKNSKGLEWFVTNNMSQNPFCQFEKYACKEEMIGFYSLLYPKKGLKEDTKIINLPKGDVEHLNEITPDLFLKNRKHKPSYLLTGEEYSKLSETENAKKVNETKFNIKKAMIKHETGLEFPDDCLMKKSRKILPVYLSKLDCPEPFYFNSENNLLFINMSHKAFRLGDARKDFYLSQMLKVATNG